MTAAMTTPGARLEVGGLSKSFAGVTALDGVTFTAEPGEIIGLIGPNGSGKTTAIECISGFQKPDSGRVRLDDTEISRRRADRLSHLGLIRTFQQVRTFETLSVRHNLRVAVLGRRPRSRRVGDLIAPNRETPELRERIDELLDAFELAHAADLPAGELSYGQRKLVEFAAACVLPARVLLLDEPVAAVNPTIGNLIREWIRRINREGTTVLLVEHNIELVVDICARLIVLDQGSVIADGDPAEVIELDEVQEAYFGG